MNLTPWPLVLAMIFGVARASTAQPAFPPDTTRTVSVTGRGSVTAVPDTASADVGVSVVDPDARKAKAAVDATVAKIVSLAKGLGVAEADLRTAAVNIEPRYDENNHARLRGYEVSQSVTAVIHDLTKLDAFLDGAVQAGANRDFNVTLSSSREVALRQQALRLAIDAAKEQADAAARQLNVRLGAVRSINLNPVSYGGVSLASARAVGSDSARFLPGTLKIDADVSVVFLIEDR
jgi:uncharacterized protein YggE